MKLKMKSITVYVGEDGKEYTNHLDATIADLIGIVESFPSLSDGIANPAKVAADLFQRRSDIAELFRSYTKIEAQKRAVEITDHTPPSEATDA